MIKSGQYDFLDFGSSTGNCVQYAIKRLNGKTHLCFDNQPTAVDELNKKGHPCVQADITQLKLPKNSVRFVTICHVLEHLHNMDQVIKTIGIAVHAARDFVFIEGPSFDFDAYLKNLGFKFFWHDSCSHCVRVTTEDVNRSVDCLDVAQRYWLTERPYVANSESLDVLSYDTPIYPNKYNKAVHPPKKFVAFKKNSVFRSWVCFLVLRDIPYAPQLLQSRPKFSLEKLW